MKETQTTKFRDMDEVFGDELRNVDYALGYLKTAFDEDGVDQFVYALKKVAKAHNMTCIETPAIAKDMNGVEPVSWTDATPDEDYVLRILRAALHNAGVKWRVEGDLPKGREIVYDLMNKAADKRAAMLSIAISLLEIAKSNGKFK